MGVSTCLSIKSTTQKKVPISVEFLVVRYVKVTCTKNKQQRWQKRDREREMKEKNNKQWIHLGNGKPLSQLWDFPMFSRFHPKVFDVRNTGKNTHTKAKRKTHKNLQHYVCQKNFVINFFLFPVPHSFLFLYLARLFTFSSTGTIYFWLINPLKYRFTYKSQLLKIQMLNTVNKRE